MDKKEIFERNLLALARIAPKLCSRLSSAETTLNRYRFLETPSGEIVPALVDPSGQAHPLHSTVDPRREARRLVESLGDNGFIILLGLGGGYYAEAALEKKTVSLVLVIDYDINGIAELLCHREYIRLFGDPRFHFLVCPDGAEIERSVLSIYQPLVHGGIHTLPLRARTAGDSRSFGSARLAIESAVKRISADYSVQAYFGTRWFSNIIRNLMNAEKKQSPLPPVRRAAVTAAGPSLDSQLSQIRERRNDFFLLAADTSLPALLAGNIVPDAVVSIDCQHISYYHFMTGLPKETTLFMDLAGPPLVASRSANTRFFSGNHPLTAYISRAWRSLPEVDTSGGNVTYAAIALAERLGAESVELFGADFSYPLGRSYARGAYIHPLFEYRHKRLAPLEGQYSAFLYRGPLQKIHGKNGWYYESPSLTFYRERLEEKSRAMETRLIPALGPGAPISVFQSAGKPAAARALALFGAGAAHIDAQEFLGRYLDEIRALTIPPNSAEFNRACQNGSVLVTLLPAAAAIKRRRPGLETEQLITETKKYCVGEIERVLNAFP